MRRLTQEVFWALVPFVVLLLVLCFMFTTPATSSPQPVSIHMFDVEGESRCAVLFSGSTPVAMDCPEFMTYEAKERGTNF